jgi:4'-phosphopantetheinyl transferase EntD
MFRLVCRPEEWLTGYDPAHPASLLHGKLLFVVKEAVYKLHHPLGGAFLDFQDVRIALDTSAGCYSAELVDPAKQGSAGRTIRGGFARANGLLIALATYYR